MSINTGSVLGLTTQWSEIETDPLSVNNMVSDVGNISYNLTYTSGTGSGQIDQIFHVNNYLSGTTADIYDMTGAVNTIFNKSVSTPFSKIKSVTIENVSGDAVEVIVHGSNGFSEPFGTPATGIPLDPSGYLHINTTGDGWVVDSTNRLITIGNDATDNNVVYEMLILGEA